MFAAARPGYHPITTGSVEGVIAEAKDKAASTAAPFKPATPGTPANEVPDTMQVPQELFPVTPAPKPAETK